MSGVAGVVVAVLVAASKVGGGSITTPLGLLASVTIIITWLFVGAAESTTLNEVVVGTFVAPFGGLTFVTLSPLPNEVPGPPDVGPAPDLPETGLVLMIDPISPAPKVAFTAPQADRLTVPLTVACAVLILRLLFRAAPFAVGLMQIAGIVMLKA